MYALAWRLTNLNVKSKRQKMTKQVTNDQTSTYRIRSPWHDKICTKAGCRDEIPVKLYRFSFGGGNLVRHHHTTPYIRCIGFKWREGVDDAWQKRQDLLHPWHDTLPMTGRMITMSEHRALRRYLEISEDRSRYQMWWNSWPSYRQWRFTREH